MRNSQSLAAVAVALSLSLSGCKNDDAALLSCQGDEDVLLATLARTRYVDRSKVAGLYAQQLTSLQDLSKNVGDSTHTVLMYSRQGYLPFRYSFLEDIYADKAGIMDKVDAGESITDKIVGEYGDGKSLAGVSLGSTAFNRAQVFHKTLAGLLDYAVQRGVPKPPPGADPQPAPTNPISGMSSWIATAAVKAGMLTGLPGEEKNDQADTPSFTYTDLLKSVSQPMVEAVAILVDLTTNVDAARLQDDVQRLQYETLSTSPEETTRLLTTRIKAAKDAVYGMKTKFMTESYISALRTAMDAAAGKVDDLLKAKSPVTYKDLDIDSASLDAAYVQAFDTARIPPFSGDVKNV